MEVRITQNINLPKSPQKVTIPLDTIISRLQLFELTIKSLDRELGVRSEDREIGFLPIGHSIYREATPYFSCHIETENEELSSKYRLAIKRLSDGIMLY